MTWSKCNVGQKLDRVTVIDLLIKFWVLNKNIRLLKEPNFWPNLWVALLNIEWMQIGKLSTIY